MRISHRHRFVFFSSPKTGSESVRALLDPLSDIRDVPFALTRPDFPFYSHIRPIEMRAAFSRFGWKYDDYYRFVFVRNPWLRLVSLYRYLLRSDLPQKPSFADWLKASRPDGTGGGGPDHVRWLKYGTYSLAAFAGDGTGACWSTMCSVWKTSRSCPTGFAFEAFPSPRTQASPG